jgi:apolipoprotein D and lipocalin family protein
MRRGGLTALPLPTAPALVAGRRRFIAAGPLALAACATGGPSDAGTLRLQASVDLDRYYGRWYIIANVPYYFERGNVGSYVEYSPRPDGGINDVYYAHSGTFAAPLSRTAGRAYVVKGTGNALWRVTFFWPIYVSYPIIYVDPGYSVALVAYPDRSLGWIFARAPAMDDATYRQMLGRFALQEYNIAAFRRVPQTAAEIGLPGYQ